jgi:hypothetical protein
MKSHASDPMKVCASLHKSVAAALERKRRLGQYAVIWHDGKPLRIEAGSDEWTRQAAVHDEPADYRPADSQSDATY